MEKFTKDYFDLLNGEYSGINLTRINTFDEFKLKQIEDSLEPYKQSEKMKESINNSSLVVDIGFGGGFPILPLAKFLPERKFIGIETRNKKVKVVSEIAQKLGLKNIKLIHSRVENVLFDLKVTCTLKAVGKVNDFLEKINTSKIIDVYFYKGPGFYEIEADQIDQAKKKWEIIEEVDINLPDVEKRRIIGFRNKEPNYTGNNLVKLSELI